MNLSPEQQAAFDKILLSDEKIMTLGGYAGSGKTTLVSEISKTVPVSIITPTWKAALVLHKRGFPEATTIHDFFLKPKGKDKDGKMIFEEDPTKTIQAAMEGGLLVVDEASMVNKFLYDTIVKNWGGRILFVGDHGQLPPVEGTFSVMENPDLRLEEIHRQAKGNPIIELATKVRLGESITELRKGDFDAGYVIGQSAFDWATSNTKDWQAIVRTNISRNLINMLTVMGRNMPIVGDRLIILDNQPRFRAYNGMVVECLEDIKKPEMRKMLQVNDGERNRAIPVNTMNILNPKGIRPDDIAKNHGVSKSDVGVGIDFAYAITCHKAQGSSFERVAVENNGWTDKRWLYTAITRAEKCVIIDRI